MKLLIINYNRVTLLQNMVEWALSMNLQPIILDNASTYDPLLDYYNTTEARVIRFRSNNGHKVLWNNPILFNTLNIKGQYLVSDPDLDMTNVPSDFLEVMQEGLRKYPDHCKCGVSLEINDLPNTKMGKEVRKWESKFWDNPLDSMYFDSEIDTTFALYRSQEFKILQSLRINRPYTAKHIPWYYDKLNTLPEDELNYIRTANKSFSWKKHMI